MILILVELADEDDFVKQAADRPGRAL